MDQQPEGNDQVTPPELVESPLRGNVHGGFEARAGETDHRESMTPRSGPTLLRQCRQPGLAAAAWDPAADRSAWGGVLGAAGPASVEG